MGVGIFIAFWFVVAASRRPPARHILRILVGVELLCAVADSDEECSLFDVLIVLVDEGHSGIDGEPAGSDMDSAQIVAVDGVELDGEVARCDCSHRGHDDVDQMELKEVAIVFAIFGQRGVVIPESVNSAIVVHAYGFAIGRIESSRP